MEKIIKGSIVKLMSNRALGPGTVVVISGTPPEAIHKVVFEGGREVSVKGSGGLEIVSSPSRKEALV